MMSPRIGRSRYWHTNFYSKNYAYMLKKSIIIKSYTKDKLYSNRSMGDEAQLGFVHNMVLGHFRLLKKRRKRNLINREKRYPFNNKLVLFIKKFVLAKDSGFSTRTMFDGMGHMGNVNSFIDVNKILNDRDKIKFNRYASYLRYQKLQTVRRTSTSLRQFYIDQKTKDKK